jgi:hypothetical protein
LAAYDAASRNPIVFGEARAWREHVRQRTAPVSFRATKTIDRNDFGVSFNAPIPGLDNAMLLIDTVAIILDVEAVLQTDSSTS